MIQRIDTGCLILTANSTRSRAVDNNNQQSGEMAGSCPTLVFSECYLLAGYGAGRHVNDLYLVGRGGTYDHTLGQNASHPHRLQVTGKDSQTILHLQNKQHNYSYCGLYEFQLWIKCPHCFKSLTVYKPKTTRAVQT